jgi:Uma2 family endonuclease
MSIATPSAPVTTDFAVPPFAVRRFSVAEYQRLTEIGMLTEDDSVELLEGHDATIDMLSEILWRLLPAGWFPRTQNVLITPDSAPEPDVVIAQGRPQDYVDHHPTPRDVALVIEVAESSLDRDWQKRGIYARAGVAVYWIVDLNADRLEVFTEPDIVAEQFQRHEQLRSSSLANISLPTGEIVTLALADILQTPAE